MRLLVCILLVSAHVYVLVCVYVRTCVCVYVRTCVCVCVCVCVPVPVCTYQENATVSRSHHIHTHTHWVFGKQRHFQQGRYTTYNDSGSFKGCEKKFAFHQNQTPISTGNTTDIGKSTLTFSLIAERLSARH